MMHERIDTQIASITDLAMIIEVFHLNIHCQCSWFVVVTLCNNISKGAIAKTAIMKDTNFNGAFVLLSKI